MSRTLQEITDAELSIVDMLWEQGECTVCEIVDAIYPDGKRSRFPIVQSLLERLEQKRFVVCDHTARPRTFEPRISRNKFLSQRFQATADALCCGSFAPLVMNLIGSRLTRNDIRKLREYLHELEPGE